MDNSYYHSDNCIIRLCNKVGFDNKWAIDFGR